MFLRMRKETLEPRFFKARANCSNRGETAFAIGSGSPSGPPESRAALRKLHAPQVRRKGNIDSEGIAFTPIETTSSILYSKGIPVPQDLAMSQRIRALDLFCQITVVDSV